MKKYLFLVLSLVLLLMIFLFTEEKKEYQSEEVYWKKSIQSIQYFPPKKEWKEYSSTEFIPEELEFKLTDRGGLNSSPLFVVYSPKNEILYEAGYNVRNLFSELSVFKIKSIADAKEEYLLEYNIEPELSPRLEIRENGEIVVLYLGKELKDKSIYSLSDGKFLLSASGYTFRRFQANKDTFRERNLVSVGNGYIRRIVWASDKGHLEIENKPVQNPSGGNQNQWRRNSGTRILFEPRLGDDLDSYLKSLRYEKFPDEDADGVPVILELVKLPKEEEWTVYTSEGRKIHITVFPKTLIGDKEYRPIIRTLNDTIKETPAYVTHSSMERLKQSGERIRNAAQWQRPEKKIK